MSIVCLFVIEERKNVLDWLNLNFSQKWKLYSGITQFLRHFDIFTPFKDGGHLYDVIITKSYLLITVIRFVSINPNETSLYNYSFLQLLYI